MKGPDGEHLERSLEPEFLPEVEAEAREDRPKHRCAPGQLTAEGFLQAVELGRHLAVAYEEPLALAAEDGGWQLSLRSADTQRSLASSVGVLMAALADQRAVDALRGKRLAIHVEPNVSLDVLQGRRFASTGAGIHNEAWQSLELGNHLLARWCHDLPWPCEAGVLSPGRCLWDEAVAEVIRRGEQAACQWLVRGEESQAAARTILASAIDLLRPKAGDAATVAIWGVEGEVLTALLGVLLGPRSCDAVAMLRPPPAARLSLELWRLSDKETKLRVIWNGREVDAALPEL